jgi:hypothetical protein
MNKKKLGIFENIKRKTNEGTFPGDKKLLSSNFTRK